MFTLNFDDKVIFIKLLDNFFFRLKKFGNIIETIEVTVITLVVVVDLDLNLFRLLKI